MEGMRSQTERLRIDYEQPARYWSLRTFRVDQQLRLDSLRFYGSLERRRRLSEEEEEPGFEPEGVAIWKSFLEDSNYSKPHTTKEALVYVEHLVEKLGGSSTAEQQAPGLKAAKNVPWVDRVTTVQDPLVSYPVRVLPDSRSKHAAVSLAIAISLGRNESDPDIIGVEEELLAHGCAFLGDDCDVRWVLHPILDFDIANDHNHTRRDDGVFVSWLLETTLEVSVHVIATMSLLCASTTSGPALKACDDLHSEMVTDDDDAIYRSIERAMGGSGVSVNVVECVQSVDCLNDVARQAAETLGTLSFASDAVKAVADANRDLWSYAQRETFENRSFFVRLEGRSEALAVHANQTSLVSSSAEPQPPPDDARRLDATPDPPTVVSEWLENDLTNSERSLYFQTLQTVHLLNSSTATFEEISKAHDHAVRAWAAVGGKTTKAGIGLCADPHVALNRLDCKIHFHVVGSMIKNRRHLKTSKKPSRRKLSDEQHEVIHQHARRHLASVCCAKFENGQEECGEQYCELHFRHTAAKRAGFILRKLSEVEGHEVQKKMTPGIQAIIENKLLPELHSDEECRITNASGRSFNAPTPTECMARSLVHHAGIKYGISPEQIRKKMRTAGFSVGETLVGIQKTMGFMKEVRSTGDRLRTSVGTRNKNEASKKAMELLRSVEKGRKLQETPESEARRRLVSKGTEAGHGGRRHGFAHSANTIRGIRKQRKLSQKIMDDHFGRVDDIAHHRRLDTPHQRHPTPRPDHFRMDQLKQHFVDPFMAMNALEADEGSLMSRFSGGLSRLNDVVDRFQGLKLKVETIQVEKELERRLESKPDSVKRFFDEIDHAIVTRRANNTKDGRRLDATAGPKELPKTHALSWLHEIIDWQKTAEEWTRVHDIVKERDNARSNGRQIHDILHEHKTGYRWLDDGLVYRHSVLGDAMRRLAQRKENGTDPHLPSIHSHRHASNFRRLAEGIFGASLVAPYALWDTTIAAGMITVPKATDNIFSATLKYVVYSTIGCYFTRPVDNVASSSFTDPNDPTKATDGETLKILRASEEKLCFPAIPLAVPTIPKFHVWTKSKGLDFETLTYEEYCTAGGYQQSTLDFFGIDVKSGAASWLGLPGILRVAEASDSIEGLVNSAKADTGREVIGYLLCSIVEFGGVLYVLVVLVLLTALLPCLQVSSFLAGIVVDVTVLLISKKAKEEGTATTPPTKTQPTAPAAATTTRMQRARKLFGKKPKESTTGTLLEQQPFSMEYEDDPDSDTSSTVRFNV